MHLLYDEHFLPVPYNKSLASMVQHPEFRDILPSNLGDALKYIRATGNRAAHYGRRVKPDEALVSVQYLYGFLRWFGQLYAEEEIEDPGPFRAELIPKAGAEQKKVRELKSKFEAERKRMAAESAALRKQIDTLAAEQDALQQQATASKQRAAELARDQREREERLAAQRERRRVPVATGFTEKQTRQHLIDLELRAAGWDDLQPGRDLEFPIHNMPISAGNPQGNGFVDYVLWGSDNKPLAIIEAKRTRNNPREGYQQARLYADCLTELYGRRPIIFLTNGYETELYDDTFYTERRRVYGFYTRRELERLIERRRSRKDPRSVAVDTEIAGRPYQLEAIQRVTESLVTDEGDRGKRRNALLVMATGSGKTRTAAALTKVLFEAGWINRVLFLADRTALVKQAQNSFTEYLPSYTSVNLGEAKDDGASRLVFSTYPTMLNRIDGEQDDGRRSYGTGYFDLIIVDEAHRSVYNLYRALFEYFDALVVGLTATPKDSIDHNTYGLFDCPDNDPTFNYELADAVAQGFLVDYESMDVSTEFLERGIRYNELSEADQLKYEETFRDDATGLFPQEIDANAVNKWLFNTDTVNKVLDGLMERGLKIEGGDVIGRSIIFAANQPHAEFIVKCFEKLYPDKPDFIQAVHNKVSHPEEIIKKFCNKEKELLPRIVVSVDMMDTGIDAPRVLNLVFFKVVRSYAKFWQMIGRGTRLCPDVFGPEQPKTRFRIFDACKNFEFFDLNAQGAEASFSPSLSQQLFSTRLQLARLLNETGDADHRALASDHLDHVHGIVAAMAGRMHEFRVNMQRRYVDEFSDRALWHDLDASQTQRIHQYLLSLVPVAAGTDTERRFDLLTYKLQLARLLEQRSKSTLEVQLQTIAQQLGEKISIPEIRQREGLLKQLADERFYEQLSQRRLEEVRAEIRDLIKYLDRRNRAIVYTDFTDSDLTLREAARPAVETREVYRDRVERYLREHRHHVAVAKLSTNQPITPAELRALEDLLFAGDLSTRADYEATFGNQPLGRFVRSILGLDPTAAQAVFAEFLQAGSLSADQTTFVQNIIQYLTQNGTIEPERLFSTPFTSVHSGGLMGVFEKPQAARIISLIREVNGNAVG